MLKESEFLVLNCCRKNAVSNQREIANEVELSLGNVNSTVKICKAKGLLSDDYDITTKGINALQPYRVRNAIIMADGVSDSISYFCKKPNGLLRVKGELLIERIINQLHEAGVTDITIVVGYMREHLYYLQRKYGVKLVVNPNYGAINDISAIGCVIDRLDNSYICSSYNYYSENVFDTYAYCPYCACLYEQDATNKFAVSTSGGVITRVNTNRVGGAWCMGSHAYLTKEFSSTLADIISGCALKFKQISWKELYCSHIKELKLSCKEYQDGVVESIDSMDKLIHFDDKYIGNVSPLIAKNICSILGCEEKELRHFVPIKRGFNSISFCFIYNGQKYFYKYRLAPDMINSNSNLPYSADTIKELGLNNNVISTDNNGGELSYYVEPSNAFNYTNSYQIKKAIGMLKTLHNSNITTTFNFDVIARTKALVDKICLLNRGVINNCELYDMVNTLYTCVSSDNTQKCFCHGDFKSDNFLVDKEGKLSLIDWEHSHMDDPASDLGTLICDANYSFNDACELIDLYLGSCANNERRHYLAYVSICAFYRLCLLIYREAMGYEKGDTYSLYNCCLVYGKRALEQYDA